VKLLFMAKVLRRLSATLPPAFNPSSELFHASPISHGAWTSGSSLSPQRIESSLRLIASNAPDKVTPFNVICKNHRDSWTIRGVRINRNSQSSSKDHVVLVSGQRSKERNAVGVSLSVAAMLAEQAPGDFSVSVVPSVDPREYERLWNREKALGDAARPDFAVCAGDAVSSVQEPVYLTSNAESSDVTDGFLHYYIRRLATMVHSLELNFSSSGATLRHKKDVSLGRQFDSSPFNMPVERSSVSNVEEVSIPLQVLRREEASKAYVIELRDRNYSLEPCDVAERSYQVLSALQEFLTEEKRKVPKAKQ